MIVSTTKPLVGQETYLTADRRPACNRRLAQWRVKWLNEHCTSHHLLWCIDSFVLRNPPLRQAPNRYRQGLRDLLFRFFWEGAWFGRGRIGDGFWERRRGRIICDAKVSDCFSGEVLRPFHRPRISATRIAFEVAPWPEKKPPLEGRYQEIGQMAIFGSFVGKPCR